MVPIIAASLSSPTDSCQDLSASSKNDLGLQRQRCLDSSVCLDCSSIQELHDLTWKAWIVVLGLYCLMDDLDRC